MTRIGSSLVPYVSCGGSGIGAGGSSHASEISSVIAHQQPKYESIVVYFALLELLFLKNYLNLGLLIINDGSMQ